MVFILVLVFLFEVEFSLHLFILTFLFEGRRREDKTQQLSELFSFREEEEQKDEDEIEEKDDDEENDAFDWVSEELLFSAILRGGKRSCGGSTDFGMDNLECAEGSVIAVRRELSTNFLVSCK
jgi:hypothetical protein